MKPVDFFRLFVCIFICLSAGFLGSIFTISPLEDWYPTLIKPSFNPPNWIFGPVWTTLYTLMGISLFLVIKDGIQKNERIAVGVFAVQLLLNSLWSILLFGLQSPQWAFLEIIVLWIAIATTMLLFFRISKTASILLVPYILWVSFAAFLNWNIYILN